MKLVKCVNGHFYDEEKYSSCPHCAGVAGASGGEEAKTEPFKDLTEGRRPIADGDVTERFHSQPADSDETGLVNYPPVKREIPGKTTPSPDLDDEKTVPMWNFNNDKDKTKGNVFHYAPGFKEVKPVVGWLVCTEGKHKGESFNLYHGKNFIGRNSDMDVCLSDDLSVSRNRHAIIVYEPKERVFYAQPGESHELVYVNDKVVLSAVQLNERDVLTVGETTLVFIPFCNKEFTW